MKLSDGFSLIEVLISLFVFSFGILAVAGLQLSTLRVTQDAYMRSVAAVQAYSMLERLRVNKTGQSRTKALANWNQQNKYLLPQGTGYYQCRQQQCDVTLTWVENNNKKTIHFTAMV